MKYEINVCINKEYMQKSDLCENVYYYLYSKILRIRKSLLLPVQ